MWAETKRKKAQSVKKSIAALTSTQGEGYQSDAASERTEELGIDRNNQ